MNKPPEKLYRCAAGYVRTSKQPCDFNQNGVCLVVSGNKPCTVYIYKLIGPMPEVEKGEGE